MTAGQARDRRAQLEATLDRAQRSYSDTAAKRSAAEVERGRAARSLAGLKTARASGGATDKEVAQAEQRLNDAERVVAQLHDDTNSAYDAVRAAEQQIDDLFSLHLDAFV